jgi:hypothetical protein
MSRWKASALHLGCSFLTLLTIGVLLSLTWYPPEYAWAAGGLVLVGILAGVDASLGPLLTLVVWDIRKPSLRFDMAVIILLQLSGLGYGLYSIYWARPVYMVFAVDRFDLVSAADIPAEALAEASQKEFKSLPLTGPRIVGARRPEAAEERQRLLFSALSGGADLPQMPRYYVPYADLADDAARKAKPLDALLNRDVQTRRTLLAYLRQKSLDPDRVKFLPLRAKYDQIVLVDGVTARVLGIVNIDPWMS